MSLTVYNSFTTVPNGIEYVSGNDAYFNLNTELRDSKILRELLTRIDGVYYYDARWVTIKRGQEECNIKRTALSTGLKTLINIIQNPDVCFDTMECGPNVAAEILKLNNGTVVWSSGTIFEDGVCDIVFQGKHYTTIQEALHAIRYY